ncbi:MAG: DUF4239 domain-containing protein [Burkholderiales bacterium]|nr:DUF4239 domain-containing protein [Burkholderiales bacterium]
MNDIPIWLVFAGTFALVALGVELGLKGGRALGAGQPGDTERQSTASVISTAVTGLTAFILSFTFGLVADRYDNRSTLVRDEANAIAAVNQLLDILPAAERPQAQALIRQYVEVRLAAHASHDPAQMLAAAGQTPPIQAALWQTALAHAQRDPNTNLSGQLVQAVNALGDLQSNRIAIGLQNRIATGIWAALAVLLLMGAMTIGYVNAVDEAKRSRLVPVLAAAFALVVTLIAVLDRPQSRFISVSQQPFLDLKNSLPPAR